MFDKCHSELFLNSYNNTAIQGPRNDFFSKGGPNKRKIEILSFSKNFTK